MVTKTDYIPMKNNISKLPEDEAAEVSQWYSLFSGIVMDVLAGYDLAEKKGEITEGDFFAVKKALRKVEDTMYHRIRVHTDGMLCLLETAENGTPSQAVK